MAGYFIYFLLFLSIALAQSDDQVADLVKMQASLFTTSGQKKLAISLKIAKGWHIYWKNPGDAGVPPQFTWFKQGQPIPLQALEWPAPQKYSEGGGVKAFGYEGLATFFFSLSPQIQSEFAGEKIILQGRWLVCAHICIQGEDSLTLSFNQDLTQLQSSPQYYSLSQPELRQAFAQLPAPMDFPEGLDLDLSRNSQGQLFLYFSLDKNSLRLDNGQDNVLFPFPHRLFDFKHEQLFQDNRGRVFGRVLLDWNGDYLERPIAFPADGIFRPPLHFSFLLFNPQTGKKDVMSTSLSRFTLDQQGIIEQFYQTLQPFSQATAIPAARDGLLLSFLLLAFLGGLILNFMPCVLPVVSLKLFSLIKNKGASRAQLLKYNGAYTLGVLLSFLSLALAIVLLKSSGESIGWGFQLQSPVFVAVMILSLFLFALNLFGLFEWAIPGGRWVNSWPMKEGLAGDFLSGVLATILSTPCTAPFLGTALTFAFTSSTAMVFLIFFFIGWGMSTPFLLTAIFPRSLVLLPRPGKWMDDLKKFLGLTLLLTIVWLYDILLALVANNYYVLLLNLTLTLLFFSVYFHHRMGKSWWSKILFYLAPVMLLIIFMDHNNLAPTGRVLNVSAPPPATGELDWQPWSEQAMQELQGELVFIDFTAQWCFTCKVNEKLFLETKKFKQLVKDKGVHLLLADWTKKDPAIARFLKQHGHVGVPVYFVQKRDGRLVSLGETISFREIEQHLSETQ